MLSPRAHSNYWRDLAQRRLAAIARLRDGLEECKRRASVRNQPNGDGHFGIGEAARSALRAAETPKARGLLKTVAEAINGGEYWTTKAWRRKCYAEARRVVAAI